ncbi:hypothetical protein [Actinomadura hibisca]|uniref:hypothetical protein n=1 Tax=Actinomadura hibisca TaxID=68565 RepID=UPI0012F85983|nr:hypothetical protein [Actinomadura hibisca]
MLELFEDELVRQLRPEDACACGQPVTHLREELLRMAQATEWDTVDAGYFEGHVYEIEWLHTPAVPVARICLAALADDIAPPARDAFVDLLCTIVAATTTSIRVGGRRDLVDECEAIIRPGTWLFYAEILSGRHKRTAVLCFEILQELNEDVERLRAVYRIAHRSLRTTSFWVEGLQRESLE